MAETPNTPQPGDDAALVREALSRLLDAITRAEALAGQARAPAARELLAGLASAHKAQVAAALAVLGALDPEQAARLPSALPAPHLEEKPAAPSAPPADERLARAASQPGLAVHATEAPPGPMAGKLTVGSLRKR